MSFSRALRDVILHYQVVVPLLFNFMQLGEVIISAVHAQYYRAVCSSSLSYASEWTAELHFMQLCCTLLEYQIFDVVHSTK